MNRPVTHHNNICGTFEKKVHTTKLPVPTPLLSNKNLNVNIDDVINGNDISTYDQAHGGNQELKKISRVITT